MRFIFLDLPAFTKDEEACETDFERWIYILKNMEILQRMPFKARKSVLESVLEELERLSELAAFSKEDRERYDESVKIYRDNLATEQWALEMGEKKGRQIGLEEGRQIGLEEGIQIGQKRGIQIGREEGMLDAARGMKARGMKTKGYPLEDIAQITGLSMEEIQKL